MDLAPDFDEFIGCLNAHGVEFLIVGAYAVAVHAQPRFTEGFDIWVRPAPDNAVRVWHAIQTFGAPSNDLTLQDLATPARSSRSA